MRLRNVFTLFFAGMVATSVALSTVASAASPLPETSPEGLLLLPDTKADTVYMREGADLSGYDKVAILDCYVAFKKNWQREQNSSSGFKVSDSDIERIKTKLADEFKKVFSKELTAAGTQVVDAAGPGVLVLRPALINLDVTAPDTMEPGVRSFSTSAGQMTLFLEVYDGVTGDLIARVIDREKATDYGSMRVRNGVTNRADADRILKKWASRLGSYLAQARAGAESGKP